MLSFIVSAYNRPKHLIGCLSSLAVQEGEEHEVLVCDNGSSNEHKEIAASLGAIYLDTGAMGLCGNCYLDPDVVLPHVHGDWLCWPSDDSYYVPGFSAIMLGAARANNWDFVYCDFLNRPTWGVNGNGSKPVLGYIDKTTFILKREWWVRVGGWPPHPNDWRDGALAEHLVRSGASHGRAPGILVVHS